MNYRLLLTFIITSCFVKNNYANILKNQDISVISANNPPYYYVDEIDYKVKGLEVDIVSCILDKMQVTYKFSESNWIQALKSTENGENDLIVHVIDTSLGNDKLLLSNPLFDRFYTFYLKRNTDIVLKKIDDVAEYKVGVASGYGLEKLLPFQIKNIYYIYGRNNGLTGLLKVYLSGIDFFLCDINICTTVIENKKWVFPELNSLGKTGLIKLNKSAVRVAFSKKIKNSKTLIKVFNEQLEIFKKSIEYKLIFSKYNIRMEEE